MRTEVVDNELSDAQREQISARNSNITTGITVVSTILDEATDVVIDNERDRKAEPESSGDEVDVYDIKRDRKSVVENLDEQK